MIYKGSLPPELSVVGTHSLPNNTVLSELVNCFENWRILEVPFP